MAGKTNTSLFVRRKTELSAAAAADGTTQAALINQLVSNHLDQRAAERSERLAEQPEPKEES